MANLKDMFQERDDALDRMTAAILEKVPNLVEASTSFIRNREGITGELNWRDISFFEDESYIMLLGVLEYEVGDTVTLPNGLEFDITEQTVNHFKRILRMGFPYQLATEGSKDEIYEYLEETELQHNQASEDEMREVLQLPVSDVDDTEFDLDDLTEEQREQLRLFAMSGGGDS